MKKYRRLTVLAVAGAAVAMVMGAGGCASSPGEQAAYVGLDEGWKRIRPLAEAGLDTLNLPPDEAAFVRTTFDNHGALIEDLKAGGSRGGEAR